ncbi:hypothetical protein PFLUV_G00152000 [Perca fluviatilis]|uniref:Uncharacterized protein n=1 Tax=Perca fluviatilis TaxID=8168 RepID=A0A6A5E041_PERFL|nr:hypothetical protein PFLUV_G00152000 [Perca fluviatilis]
MLKPWGVCVIVQLSLAVGIHADIKRTSFGSNLRNREYLQRIPPRFDPQHPDPGDANFNDQEGESSLQELRQGLKASHFIDFCRQTFQFQQCNYNCERWGRYFMAAVFSVSVYNFRTFSLFLMSVISCEVGRSRGTDSPLCTAFVGVDHPMVTNQPWPEHLRRGFYGCTADNYEMAPRNIQIWLDEVVAKENALYIKSKQMMNAVDHDEQTELAIFGRVKVMNTYVFSSYIEFFRGTPEGKKLKRGCTTSLDENLNP